MTLQEEFEIMNCLKNQKFLKRLGAVPDAYLLTGKADKFIEPCTCYIRLMEKNGIIYVTFSGLRHTFHPAG